MLTQISSSSFTGQAVPKVSSPVPNVAPLATPCTFSGPSLRAELSRGRGPPQRRLSPKRHLCLALCLSHFTSLACLPSLSHCRNEIGGPFGIRLQACAQCARPQRLA